MPCRASHAHGCTLSETGQPRKAISSIIAAPIDTTYGNALALARSESLYSGSEAHELKRSQGKCGPNEPLGAEVKLVVKASLLMSIVVERRRLDTTRHEVVYAL
jgi:hypothetical protein